MVPLFVSGHACEFLVARLDVDGEKLRLEITADYGGNPLILDEGAAREALAHTLQVKTAGRTLRLADLAPLKIEPRQQWDPQAPTAFAPAPDGQPHQLLTAVWEWQADVDELSLRVPDGNLHDVLLWTRSANLPGKGAKWMMLIEGESTSKIELKRTFSVVWAVGVSVLLSGGLLLWSCLKSPTSRLSF